MRGVIVASDSVPAQSSGLLLAQVGHPTATPTAKATATTKASPKATLTPYPRGTPHTGSPVTVIVPNGQLNVTIGGAKKGQTATPRPATPAPRPATPTSTATASATPVPGTISTPTLNEQVVAWTWTVVLVIAALAAVIFGLKYLNFVFGKATSPQSAAAEVPDPDERLARRRRNTVVIFVLLGMVVVGLLWIPMVPDLNAQRWIPLEFAAVGILFSGALFGFLFGLPKLNDSGANANANANTNGNANTTAVDAGAPARTAVYRPSTNLEEVVERIATLLAGVALAQLIALPGYIASFAKFISAGLGGGTIQSASVLATGIILYFAPLGFVLSYLCTKTIIAPEIANVDEALVGFARNKAVVDDFPILPDATPDPTPDQQSAALKIVSHPLSSLTTASQKGTWGRAQLMLKNLDDAVNGLAQAQALATNDPHILADYAQALYQQDDSHAYYALRLAQDAERAASPDDYALVSRIRGLQAVLWLYIPGGYESAIKIVNQTLKDSRLAAGTTLRYFRACGFGQMWRAIDEQNPTPPDAANWKKAIAKQIVLDTQISLAYPGLRDKFMLVIGLRDRAADSHDDDLQAFARGEDAAPFLKVLNVEQKVVPEPRPLPVPLPVPNDPLALINDSTEGEPDTPDTSNGHRDEAASTEASRAATETSAPGTETKPSSAETNPSATEKNPPPTGEYADD